MFFDALLFLYAEFCVRSSLTFILEGSIYSPCLGLFLVSSVRRIIGGVELRKTFQANRMHFSDPVLEVRPVDIIFDLATAKNAFHCNELTLLESLANLDR